MAGAARRPATRLFFDSGVFLEALLVPWSASRALLILARHRVFRLVLADHLIRHQADVPILVAALRARPDWLVTTNTRHFSAGVASRTALRICTPKALIAGLRL
jgi:hypothetical protein